MNSFVPLSPCLRKKVRCLLYNCGIRVEKNTWANKERGEVDSEGSRSALHIKPCLIGPFLYFTFNIALIKGALVWKKISILIYTLVLQLHWSSFLKFCSILESFSLPEQKETFQFYFVGVRREVKRLAFNSCVKDIFTWRCNEGKLHLLCSCLKVQVSKWEKVATISQGSQMYQKHLEKWFHKQVSKGASCHP